MAKQTINVGTTANDKKGDSLRAAFQKVNLNFTELYEAVGLADTGQDTTLTFLGSTISTDDSSSIVIDRATTVTSNLSVGGDLLPQTANGGDLGSSTLPWRSLYVSNNTIYIGGTAVGIDSNGALTTGGTVVGSTPAWANITGKPTFATVATSGAYADLTGKPTIPTDFKGSVFADDSTLMIDAVDNKIYATELTAGIGNFVNVNSNNVDVENINGLSSQIYLSVGGNTNLVIENNLVTIQNVSLAVAGDITLGGNIRSEGNINIEINLSDSTLRRWQFGEDGVLNVPGDIVRNGSPGLTLGASHNVYIVGDRGDNNRTWTFDGTGGDTILPNGTVIADDGNDGIEVIMPTTVGQANTFKWRFTDQAFGTSTMSLQAGTLDTNLDDWYFGFNSTKYLGIHGTGQYISWFNGADLGGRLIFGETSGNNAGDVNAIELKATDGDVYVTSTESVKITVDANDSSARVWTFDPTGTLTAPGDIIATGNVGEFGTVNADYLGHITGQTQIQIGDGNLANGQTIVITDQRVRILAAVPATSIGSSGDSVGSVAFNSTYIYYCTANYDGVTNIWKRLAWSGDTW